MACSLAWQQSLEDDYQNLFPMKALKCKTLSEFLALYISQGRTQEFTKVGLRARSVWRKFYSHIRYRICGDWWACTRVTVLSSLLHLVLPGQESVATDNSKLYIQYSEYVVCVCTASDIYFSPLERGFIGTPSNSPHPMPLIPTRVSDQWSDGLIFGCAS